MSPKIGKSSKISVAAAIATVAAKMPKIARNANVSPPLWRSTSESPENILLTAFIPIERHENE